jgi:hypothetical protein
MEGSHFRLLARAEQAPLLGLPWSIPLGDWSKDRFVEV